MHRRDVMKLLGAAALLPATSTPAASRGEFARNLRYVGEPVAFDYAALKSRAQALAAAPYEPPVNRLPPEIKQLDWDQYQSIRYDPGHALWAGEHLPFTARFFHLGLYFQFPVRIHDLRDGYAREIGYDAAMFDHSKSGLAGVSLPSGLGFAGFRILHRSDPERDIVAFLGASYFRAVAAEKQYGLSARGLAVNTGLPQPEEFPRFTDFWLQRPDPAADRLTVYALLDSESIAGAYRFDIVPGDTLVMDVDAALYPRAQIERMGIAPLTSMFLHGENDRRMAIDWRPEIHDSDGLALWTGNGERIWRPLVNPEKLTYNAYIDDNPRGFGLLQRDRDFAHYQDDGAFYDRRPSLWVEPRGRWGKGAVSLVEIPTVDETFDNIVAFWHPERKPQPGEELLYSYRLHWGERSPARHALGRVVATHTGIGGVVGRPRKYYSRRFVVDFAGEIFSRLPAKARVEPVIDTTRGEIEITSARPLHPIRGYRAMFDLKPTDERTDPINLRLYLRYEDQPLTETWLYQWTPPPPEQRKFKF